MRAIILVLTVLAIGSIILSGCTQAPATQSDANLNNQESILAEEPNITVPEENSLAGTCPKGITDDPYPGSCGQYIDKDNDGFCDRG